jgi:hypothetical protein
MVGGFSAWMVDIFAKTLFLRELLHEITKGRKCLFLSKVEQSGIKFFYEYNFLISFFSLFLFLSCFLSSFFKSSFYKHCNTICIMDIPIVRTTAQIDAEREHEEQNRRQQEEDRIARQDELYHLQLKRVSHAINEALANKESFVKLYSTELYPKTQKLLEEKGYQCIHHPSNQMYMSKPPRMKVGDVTIYFDYDAKRNPRKLRWF